MGIPVLTNIKSSNARNNPRSVPSHFKKEAVPKAVAEYSESELTNPHAEDYKIPSDVSRMGNYFNIVIAPPPIKSLQSRKMVQNNRHHIPEKSTRI